jgi:hypothetical protein
LDAAAEGSSSSNGAVWSSSSPSRRDCCDMGRAGATVGRMTDILVASANIKDSMGLLHLRQPPPVQRPASHVPPLSLK